MYEFIKGFVDTVGAGYVVIETGNWGIKVFVPANDLVKIKKGEATKLYIYEAKYDDHTDLYGFLTRRGRDIFESMLKVPGIGPRISYSIISSIGEDMVMEGVEREDPTILARAKGVGKKKAGMIILQLKGVLKTDVVSQKPSFWHDAYRALISMGYTDKEVEKAFKSIEGENIEIDNVAELIKLLLKNLKG